MLAIAELVEVTVMRCPAVPVRVKVPAIVCKLPAPAVNVRLLSPVVQVKVLNVFSPDIIEAPVVSKTTVPLL